MQCFAVSGVCLNPSRLDPQHGSSGTGKTRLALSSCEFFLQAGELVPARIRLDRFQNDRRAFCLVTAIS